MYCLKNSFIILFLWPINGVTTSNDLKYRYIVSGSIFTYNVQEGCFVISLKVNSAVTKSLSGQGALNTRNFSSNFALVCGSQVRIHKTIESIVHSRKI